MPQRRTSDDEPGRWGTGLGLVVFVVIVVLAWTYPPGR
jgi:hypothetical protein